MKLKGFIIADKDALSEETRKRLEKLGYVVIEKNAGRDVYIQAVPK